MKDAVWVRMDKVWGWGGDENCSIRRPSESKTKSSVGIIGRRILMIIIVKSVSWVSLCVFIGICVSIRHLL